MPKILPDRLKSRWLVAFCLMSLIPILTEVYLLYRLSAFRDQSQSQTGFLTLTLFFIIFMAFCGFYLTRQLIYPIIGASRAVKRISEGQPHDESMAFEGVTELEELSQSLRAISSSAKELLEKVERLTPEDKLTGLYSAGYLQQRLKEEIQRAIHYQRPCSFVYFSIDHFDEFASTRGAAAADEILKTTARLLTGYVGADDRAARLQKDEFAIILPDKNKKKAISIMEKMSEDVSKSTQGVCWTLSVGISENPIDGVTAEALMAKAQSRMRHARTRGGSIEAFHENQEKAS